MKAPFLKLNFRSSVPYRTFTHISKDPVELDPMLYHHEEHEDHEAKTEPIGFPLRILRALRGRNRTA